MHTRFFFQLMRASEQCMHVLEAKTEVFMQGSFQASTLPFLEDNLIIIYMFIVTCLYYVQNQDDGSFATCEVLLIVFRCTCGIHC